jgi:hypothetical protein
MRLLVIFTLASGVVSCGPQAPAQDPAQAPAAGDPAGATSPSAGSQTPPGSKVNGPGGLCGGIAGFSCTPGLYCAFAPEATCGAADMTGTCTAIPAVCTEEFAPVCGCDDKTYPNACHAARASVSVVKKGECGPGK